MGAVTEEVDNLRERVDCRDEAALDTFARTDAAATQENAAKIQFLSDLEKNPQLLLTTAGSSFDGFRVTEYLDTISTDGMVGSGIPSAVDAVAADLTGQRSMELTQKMERAKRIAWEELLWRAHSGEPTEFWAYGTTCTCPMPACSARRLRPLPSSLTARCPGLASFSS